MPKKLSQEEFIERCKKKHNNYYSYDKTVYTGMSNDDYIIVTCPIHGDFKQLAAGHIRGKGCKDCAGTITKTTEQFIIDARKVHGDEYDYSKSKYINAMTYIEIICRKHGSFWQKPNTHLIGKGCFECYGSKMLTQEEFINRCIEKHNGFYIYDKTIYTGCNYTITITCPVHGDFQQKAGAHLYGQGCSQCAHLISTQELELREFLGTIYENEMIFNSRAFIKPKELDIYLPDIKTAFEYNGNYWHALYEENDPGYHDYKRQLCKNAGITLIEVWGNDWTEFNKETKNEIKDFFSAKRLKEYKHIQISNAEEANIRRIYQEIKYCPVITSNDTTLNLPNTNVSSLTAQTLISNGVSTFNNEIKVSTIAPLSSSPIEVTAPVNFTSNSDTNFSGNINTPNINVTDLVTVASSKIQTNDLGEFIIGQNIQTPTTANNGAHRFTVTDINKTAIALGHKIVKNGTWATGWVIPTDRWDFTYNGEAILQVKEPKTDKEASNKLYVDTSLNSKANSADVYTKTESDNKYATKTEVTAIKTTADAAAPQATTYTKTESDSKYATKIEVAAIKTTADNAAPQSTTYTKTEVDTSLNTIVKLTGNQTVAGVKTFTDNVKIPLPQANDDAASKEYVDAVVADIPVYNPAEAQTITGAYDFQDGLTRATKNSPLATDIMNKEMSDALYIPKTGNSDIGGIKTFTDGIILADEKQLQLGAGTDALKIHGTGNGKAVIEGSNISELDIAVPVNIQENLQVENLTVDITNRGLVDFITFQNEAASLSNMQFFIDSSTNNIGIKPADSDGGFQVQNNGWLVALSTFQANGSFISQGGATFSQSITVAGTATLNNGISLKNGITFYDNTSVQEAKIIGEYGSPDESAIVFADSASVDYLKFNHHSANKQVQISPQVSGDTIVFPELPESTVTPTNINQFTNKNYIDETIQQNLNTTLEGVIKFVSMTEAEYKALETKSPSTIYHLTDVSMWAIGDQEIVTSNMPA